MSDSFTRRATLGAAAGVLGWTALSVGSSGQIGGGGGGRDAPPDFGGWLDGANNYDGTVDRTGQATVTVRVAAGEGKFAFDPAAVHVDAGATVRWKWTGDHGAHNVVSAGDGPLDSGPPVGDPGVHYEYTFEADGIYPYRCRPHQALGMKGAIVVGDDYPRRAVTPTPTPTPRPTAEGEWPAEAGTPWPESGFDAANTRAVPVEGPTESVRASGLLESGEPIAGLVSDGDRLFVGHVGTVVAVDATTGERRWERPGEWPLAVGDGRLYAARNPEWERERSETDTLRSRIACLDAATGERQWERRLPNGPINALSLTDGRLVVGATGGTGVFDPATGDRRWWRETGDTVRGLAVGDGRVYVSADANFGTSVRDPRLRLRAVDVEGGARRWQFERESYPPTAPVVADGRVYVGSRSHAVHVRDAATGEEVWTADLGSSATGLAVADGRVYVGCHDYHLYAFDAASGDRQWRTRTRGTVGPPAVASGNGSEGDGLVYAANLGALHALEDDGDIERHRAVHGFDPASGEQRWTVEIGRWQNSAVTPAVADVAPLLTDGTLYVPENRTRYPHRLQVVTGASARNGAAGTPEPTATSDGTGGGFTALGTALAMLGVAGYREWRDGD
ncbi:MAG: halocyanin domain-containing protein [Halorientalis sp.]